MPSPDAFTVTLSDGRTLNWTVDATTYISEHNFYNIFDPQPEEQPMPTTTPLDTVVRYLQHSWIGTASTPVRGEDLRALVEGRENPPLYLRDDDGEYFQSQWYMGLDGTTRDPETAGHLAPYAHVLDQLIDMDATVISRSDRYSIDLVHGVYRYFVHYTIEPDGDDVYGSARVWFVNNGDRPWQLATWSGSGIGNHDHCFSTEVQRRWLDQFIDALCYDHHGSDRITHEQRLREQFLNSDNTLFDMWSLLDDDSNLTDYEPLYI